MTHEERARQLVGGLSVYQAIDVGTLQRSILAALRAVEVETRKACAKKCEEMAILCGRVADLEARADDQVIRNDALMQRGAERCAHDLAETFRKGE